MALDVLQEILKILVILDMVIEDILGHRGVNATDFRVMKHNAFSSFIRRFDPVGVEVDLFHLLGIEFVGGHAVKG